MPLPIATRRIIKVVDGCLIISLTHDAVTNVRCSSVNYKHRNCQALLVSMYRIVILLFIIDRSIFQYHL